VGLQGLATELAAEQIAVFAISYDSVATLAAFATRYGITYRLLSDEGSRVIRALGLLNEQIFEHHAYYNIARDESHYGVPYPGVYVLDQDGLIVDKRFQQSFRERETAVGLVEGAFGLSAPHHGAEALTTTAGVQVRADLDSPTYRSYQRLRLALELDMAPGLHIYGQPVSHGYVPLTVEVAPIAGLVVGEARWPTPREMILTAIYERLWIYERVVRGSLPLTFEGPSGTGDHLIRVSVTFQGCTATDCFPPSRVTLELPVREKRHADSAN
jgi:peroxiredoxin